MKRNYVVNSDCNILFPSTGEYRFTPQKLLADASLQENIGKIEVFPRYSGRIPQAVVEQMKE